jgi:hypothetical protein
LDSISTPPLVIATLHAALHALNLVFLYLLTELLICRTGAAPKRAELIGFWLMGAIAPIYWTLVGTSFADLLTSVTVLAGLWLAARTLTESGGLRMKGIAWIAAAGALMGAAVGARIHNSIYVVGLLCAVLFTPLSGRSTKFRLIGAYSLAAFAAWLLCFIPWAYRLYAEFGSPLFPLFNGVFRSPDFPASNVSLLSFVPGSFWEFITLPFWMGTDAPWVYVELPLPDIRPALLALSLFACGLLWLFRRARWWNVDARGAVATNGDGEAPPSRRLILIFFAASAGLWLATSGNGRFGVTLFLLGGPVCGVVLSQVLPRRYLLVLVAAVLLWQALLQQVFFRQYRFNSVPWTARYFDWALSERLTREPATFFSLGFQPASTLAPHLHPGSSHINLAGYPAVDAPGSDRLRRILGVPNRPIFALVDVRHTDPKTVKTHYRNQLALWGLTFSDERCGLIRLKPPSPDWAWINTTFGVGPRYQPPAFLACSLQHAMPAQHQHAISEYQHFADKVARFGANCPQYFGRPLGYTHTDKGWAVTSFASAEVRLDFYDDGPFYVRQVVPPHVSLKLGRVTRDKIIADEPDCRRWFSRLSQLATQAARHSGEIPER